MSPRVASVLLCLAAALAAQTRVVVLGSGNPNAIPERSGPAVAVIVNQTAYLVDSGPGVVRRAAAAARAGEAALRPTAITHLFVTHLHSDHTAGYPDLILTPAVLGRAQPLEVYGPPGLQAMTTDILHAWSKDIAVRTQGLEHGDPDHYRVEVHEIKAGQIYRDANVTVTAFAVHHGSWDYAFGYRFQAADRTVVFSGDTTPVAAVAQACDGCDLLFHEAYLDTPTIKPAWRNYLAHFHTSAAEVGAIASAAHPKLLVLYHQMFEGGTEAQLLAAVRAHYAGAVVSAHDLDVY
ncbi:MAG: MBL fold metallo-hydrolase [Terriglobales bacterium]